MRKLAAILIILEILTLASCSSGDLVVYEGFTSVTSSSEASETSDTTSMETQSTQKEEYEESSTANETHKEDETDRADEGVLVLVSLTESVKAGSTAAVSVKGKPNTEYDINVYYSTTVGTAKGLENKYSDEDGNVSWSWKVGSRTKKGTFKITVTGGDQTLILYFDVT